MFCTPKPRGIPGSPWSVSASSSLSFRPAGAGPLPLAPPPTVWHYQHTMNQSQYKTEWARRWRQAHPKVGTCPICRTPFPAWSGKRYCSVHGPAEKAKRRSAVQGRNQPRPCQTLFCKGTYLPHGLRILCDQCRRENIRYFGLMAYQRARDKRKAAAGGAPAAARV